MNRYSALLLTAVMVFLAVGIIAVVPEGVSGDTAGVAATSVKTVQQRPAVDGSVNPEQVSDQVAYTLLFRLLANRHTPAAKSRR
jgi:hypothetical protein